MKISINEPCHENWDGMTPNDKGAFCHRCEKDVVDFSRMGISQIKNFFSKPQDNGKVCGRFKESQLQELSFDDFFSRFTYWNFSRKFAVIFFMAFGFWIFSNTAVAQSNEHLTGKVMYVPDKNPKADPLKNPKQPKTPKHPKTPKGPKHPEKIGMVSCEKPKEKEKILMGDVYVPLEEKHVPPSSPKR
ncbi:MAG: hypothetical protein ACXVC6_12910 [Bacteroidia bacterium]